MKEITAKDAKNGFGRLLDIIQSTPVRVTRNGRPVGIVMSVRQFERLRGAAWERLAGTMDALGREAAANHPDRHSGRVPRAMAGSGPVKHDT